MASGKARVSILASLLLAACGNQGGPAYPLHSDVQFHLATFVAQSGFRLADSPPGMHAIYLNPNIIVGTRDIVSVRDGGCPDGKCRLIFQFNAEGAKRMLRASRVAIDRPMATLVNGKVVSVAVVVGQIQDSLEQSTTSEEQSQALLRQIASVPGQAD